MEVIVIVLPLTVYVPENEGEPAPDLVSDDVNVIVPFAFMVSRSFDPHESVLPDESITVDPGHVDAVLALAPLIDASFHVPTRGEVLALLDDEEPPPHPATIAIAHKPTRNSPMVLVVM